MTEIPTPTPRSNGGPPPQPLQPQRVQPAPSNETWEIEAQPGRVIVRISHVCGAHVSFMPSGMALQLGEMLANAGRQSQTGIVVPPPDFTLPPSP